MSLALGACSASSGTGGGADATGPRCGDGVCASSEVNSCPQDCGSPSGNNAVCGNGFCETGETSASCPTDCGLGSGSGSGSGSGTSGTLNCSDQNTVLACAACLALSTCTPPYDANSCQACLGGGLGSGLGSGVGSGCPTGCNCDGVCDPGETSAQCPLDNCP
ncbi:MAG: hypothetical protein ACM31C_10405 [Acidobacteriota bacterium]